MPVPKASGALVSVGVSWCQLVSVGTRLPMPDAFWGVQA